LPQRFLDLLEALGYNFFTGVPCSLFEGVTRILDREPRYGYVSAVREDSALAIAAGAHLGGRQPVVLMQNSGLGVSVNAIVSLNQIYGIPALIVVSWRGQPAGSGEQAPQDWRMDAPEHIIMGGVTRPFLDLLKIPFAVFDPATIEQDLASLTQTMRETRKPVALVVPKGMLQ